MEVKPVTPGESDAGRADDTGTVSPGPPGGTAIERQVGACCFSDGSCVVTDAVDCGILGGTYEGDGTTCDPNCCSQDPTGSDCACYYDYMECHNGGEPTGAPCEIAEDCELGETCDVRACTGPTQFSFVTMEILVDPPEYVIFSGDSSGAEFSPELGDDCTTNTLDMGWYEGFELIDDTPVDAYDDCWVVTVDGCCRSTRTLTLWVCFDMATAPIAPPSIAARTAIGRVPTPWDPASTPGKSSGSECARTATRPARSMTIARLKKCVLTTSRHILVTSRLNPVRRRPAVSDGV
jgi:hypothetical protein